MPVTRSKPKAQAEPESDVRTAKLFRNGRSQAVRLPREFRFEGTEVAIRRDPETGEVILSQSSTPNERSFNEWFALLDAIPDDAPESAYDNLPPRPLHLTMAQTFQVLDRLHVPEDFLSDRKKSMPRERDLF